MSPVEVAFNESLKDKVGKSTPRTPNGLQKVVIDAGHGGKDPGGMGPNSQEKHIALNIARLLAIGIRTNYPEVEVLMTRSDDTFVPLYERANLANKAGANLFISIHANIMPGSSATAGTETFVMGQHVAEQNLEVAKRENAAIMLESGDVNTNYGYDPNSPEGHILLSMQQNAFLERSILFAEAVEQQFGAIGRKSRGVKQAGFVVLKATTMPAVLVETGFMSNPAEEQYLLSDQGQQRLASALLEAFGNYYRLVSGDRNAPVASRTTDPAFVLASASLRPRPSIESKPRQLMARTPAVTTLSLVPDVRPVGYAGEHPQLAAKSGGAIVRAPAAMPVAPPPSVSRSARPAVLAKEVMPAQYAQAKYAPAPARDVPGRYVEPLFPTATDSFPAFHFRVARQRVDNRTIDLSRVPDSEFIFAVQLIATHRQLDLTQDPYRSLAYDIRQIAEGKFNKYQIRNLPTAVAAQRALDKSRSAGFPDAMAVVYYRGKRLPPASVNYLLSRAR